MWCEKVSDGSRVYWRSFISLSPLIHSFLYLSNLFYFSREGKALGVVTFRFDDCTWACRMIGGR